MDETTNFVYLRQMLTPVRFLDPVLADGHGQVYYEGRLIGNAHSEISRKRDHIFKQTKVGSKAQYFSYKLTYLFFDIVALSFNTFFPT